MENIVRGHISLDDYARSTASPNAVIGRGPRGEKLDKVIWDVELLKEPDAVGVRLRFPGMHGAPGVKQASDLKNIVVTYWLNDDNEFEIVYEYVAGGIAPEGVTHNIYFSLCGTDGDGALDHQLAIAADNFYPVDKDQTLFGSHRSVRDTPFDFLNPERIGARISSDDEQLQFGDGYNHCWTLNGGDDGDVVATIFDPQSGRYMEIMTPNPCLQFSSARPEDKLRPDNRGFCIKAQLPPGESVKAGELVRLRTVYHFSTL
jgi:aldose 1-epimerase